MAQNGKTKVPDERSALMKRARKGDHAAARQFKEKYPEISGILKELYGGPPVLARDGLLTLMYGEMDVLLRGFAEERLEEMRNELCGVNPTHLERLLIDRILLCWLHLHYLEWNNAKALKGSMPLEKAEFYQRVIDRAHSRYLSAVKSLALVRRLQIPLVQLNIADKQVNLVQGQNADPKALPAKPQGVPLPQSPAIIEGALVSEESR